MFHTLKQFISLLLVALQYPALAADQQNICSMLQVCKAWRTAVQHSDACLTNLIFRRKLPYPAESTAAIAAVAELVQFAQWVS